MRPLSKTPLLALLVWLASGWALCGCVDPDAGFDEVRQTVQQRTGYRAAWTRGAAEDSAAEQAVAELLRDELTVHEAVQVALLSNRSLQAGLEQLGISRGQLIQASLGENPVFSGEWRFFSQGTAFEGVLAQNLISIVTIPMRRRLHGYRHEAEVLQAAAQVVRLAADVRRAYFTHQANRQLVELLGKAVQATRGAYIIRARMRQAGNARQLDVLRERAMYEEAKIAHNAGIEQLARSRERLNVLMGLWGKQTHWELAARLPEPPGAGVKGPSPARGEQALKRDQLPERLPPATTRPGEGRGENWADRLAGPPANQDLSTPDWPDLDHAATTQSATRPAELDAAEGPSARRFEQVERAAMENSLDLASAWRLVQAEAGRLRLETTLAVFPFLDAGATAERDADGEWGVGPAISTPVPLFDLGQARVPQELSRLRQRLELYAALATDIRAMARTAEARVQATRSRALYMRDVVLPLHSAIVAETQLQYNAMQEGPFRLLEAKVRQIRAGQQYVGSLLEYWLARTDLEQLLDGSLPHGILRRGVSLPESGRVVNAQQLLPTGAGAVPETPGASDD